MKVVLILVIVLATQIVRSYMEHTKLRKLIVITNRLQNQKDSIVNLLKKNPHSFNLHFQYDSLNRLYEVAYLPKLTAAQDREDDSDN